MRCLTYFARVLGLCVLGLGAIAFMGCSGSGNSLGSTTNTDGSASTGGDSSGTTTSTTGFTAVLPGPRYPTCADWDLAKATPHDEDDACATLDPFSISAACGRIIKVEGERELKVCCHDNRGGGIKVETLNRERNENESPLANNSDFTSVKSLLPIIFPEGRNCLKLSDDTELKLGQFNGTLSNPLFNTEIEELELLFDVDCCYGQPTWTLPTSVAFTSKMANNMSVINGSQLTMTWNPCKGSIPPHGRAYVVAKFTFFSRGHFLGCITKAVPVCNNVATFTADALDCDDPTLYFDEVEICFDLTNCVPNQCDGEDHGNPSAT